MKSLKLRNSAGDTIIEVMIVLAVLSFAFGISYATATHGLAQSQNAEEHSEALSLLNSQVEMVRAYFVSQQDPTSLTSGSYDFCMTNTASPTVTPLNDNVKVPANESQDVLSGINSNYPAGCTSSFYDESIDYNLTDPTDPYFDFRVRWEGSGTLGLQQEELTYKIFSNSVLAGATPPVGGQLTAFPTINWTANGKSYTNCVHDASDPVVGDNEDGCDPSGSPQLPSTSTAEFSRRGVDITYSLGSTQIPVGEKLTLTISYQQYSLANTYPPINFPGYEMHLFSLDSSNSPSTLVSGGVTLPITGGKIVNLVPSYTTQTFTHTFVNPTNDPASIQLDWFNNTGNDPDLQINSVSLTGPTP